MIQTYFQGLPVWLGITTVVVYGLVLILALFCALVLIPEIVAPALRESLAWCKWNLGPIRRRRVIDFTERRRELVRQALADETGQASGAMTHYLPWDDPDHDHRFARAVCGRVINPRRETANEPTCPKCAEYLREKDNAPLPRPLETSIHS